VQSLDQVLKMAGRSTAIVYTLGVFDAEDPDRNPGVLRRLARETGGESFLPGHLSDALAEACRTIARDIRHQYTIGYVSANTAVPDAYRTIQVAARAAGSGKLIVRTRAGYIAGGEPLPVPAKVVK
jgi:Ca-activated chloride channel homolog